LKKAVTRNRFTEEQQRAAVTDLQNMTIAKVAAKYGCSSASLMTWKRKYGTSKPAGRPGSQDRVGTVGTGRNRLSG
jgi:transposase-like protein